MMSLAFERKQKCVQNTDLPTKYRWTDDISLAVANRLFTPFTFCLDVEHGVCVDVEHCR